MFLTIIGFIIMIFIINGLTLYVSEYRKKHSIGKHEIYVCQKCGYKMEVHNRNKKNKCIYCNEQFNNVEALYLHQKNRCFL